MESLTQLLGEAAYTPYHPFPATADWAKNTHPMQGLTTHWLASDQSDVLYFSGISTRHRNSTLDLKAYLDAEEEGPFLAMSALLSKQGKLVCREKEGTVWTQE